MVTSKGLLVNSMVNSKAVILTSEILGESKNPGLSGIMGDHSEKGDLTDQIAKAAIEMPGSVVNWDNPGTWPDQTYDKSSKGKSKITEEGVNGETDKIIEDFMADSLKDMDLLFSVLIQPVLLVVCLCMGLILLPLGSSFFGWFVCLLWLFHEPPFLDVISVYDGNEAPL
ncbi:hypothetical protein V6N11_007271 [Hibiscus sabdariffa]|uniref:Uncharacterized protein n=1 Tax=Hibiscus sabdariffa TaxID=183260 RepID=A0ABR2RTP5_9ROSI